MSSLKYPLNLDPDAVHSIRLLYVTVANDEGDWPSFMHSHHFTELFYVKSGCGRLLVEDQSIPIEKDDLIIVNPNTAHTECSDPRQPLSYITIGVEGLNFSFQKEKEYSIFNCAKVKDNLLFYFNSMLSEMEHQADGYQEICISMLNILTIHIKRITHSAFDVMVSERSNLICARIKRHIDSNYQDTITLDSLASLAHLNKYYFVHAFTKAYGLSPISYLNERRLQVSKELLETTDHSIAEVAQLSGFASQSYFSQSFRKSCHMTPGEYRRKVQQKNSAARP